MTPPTWAVSSGPPGQLSRCATEYARDGLVVLGFSLDDPDDVEQVRVIAGDLSFPAGLLGDPHVAGYGRICVCR